MDATGSCAGALIGGWPAVGRSVAFLGLHHRSEIFRLRLPLRRYMYVWIRPPGVESNRRQGKGIWRVRQLGANRPWHGMAASSFAPPLLLHVTTSIVCCFCFHFFDLKEGESFSSRRGKSETVQLQPSQKDRIFLGEKKKTFSSFEIQKS